MKRVVEFSERNFKLNNNISNCYMYNSDCNYKLSA